MVVNLFLGIVIAILTGVLGLAPAYELPDTMRHLGTKLGEAVGSIDGVFPVTTLGICLGVLVAARLFIAAWALLSWLYAKIPFKMT